eukprot:TRINITY_DN1135_c0_g1_i1.p1 TRINITY_DN1135_c0_g1~~TRINITY_DN1135_c0_g1_i1.p1  ORF type:complete len:181 (-),score=28.85 TRINITY_DN1135_c0_g1_i1:153-695(-)
MFAFGSQSVRMAGRRVGARWMAAAAADKTAAAATAAAPEGKVVLSLAAPGTTVFARRAVDAVYLPGASGIFGVLPNHVATVSELRPGLVTLEDKDAAALPDKEKAKGSRFFVSGGFAVVKDSHVQISALEVVPVDHIDPDAVRSALADATKRLADAKTDAERTEAQIALEFHTTLAASLA